MNRYQFEDLISEYIENELSLKKRKEFEAFLNENPKYIELIESIKSNINSTKKLPIFRASKSFNENILEKISKNHFQSNYVKSKNTYFGFSLFDFSIISSFTIAFIILSIQLFVLSTENQIVKNEFLVEKNESSTYVDSNSNGLANVRQNPSKVQMEEDSLGTEKTIKLKKNFSKKIQLVND